MAQQLNYKHLHYFWVVAKSGGVTHAGEQLNVTPQAISTQMRSLEQAVGGPLWRRAGRKIELTDTGHLVLEYAERMFGVAEGLKAALQRRGGGSGSGGGGLLRIGLTGPVVKVVAYRTLAPALSLSNPPQLQCRSGRFNELLALLAVHELDLVLSDRPMPSTMNVRGFNHLLSEGGVSFMAVPALAKRLMPEFPYSLNASPLLLPSDSAVRSKLQAWFDHIGVQPKVVASFDDSAVMKAFGQAGAGVFPMPSSVAKETAIQFKVVTVGRTDDVKYQLYAVSTERHLRTPAVVAIREAARALDQEAVEP
jgi:LysR family transcriptional regulator, transcriptional activator of nhaA